MSKEKEVMVQAEFVNLVPAHDRYITKPGKGATVPVAIKRAIDEIFSDPRLKHKRITLPVKMVVMDGKEIDG
jgi:hypothetical protein